MDNDKPVNLITDIKIILCLVCTHTPPIIVIDSIDSNNRELCCYKSSKALRCLLQGSKNEASSKIFLIQICNLWEHVIHLPMPTHLSTTCSVLQSQNMRAFTDQGVGYFQSNSLHCLYLLSTPSFHFISKFKARIERTSQSYCEQKREKCWSSTKRQFGQLWESQSYK